MVRLFARFDSRAPAPAERGSVSRSAKKGEKKKILKMQKRSH